ncbi:hypothetical protein ACA910_017682 [Epithemia clementina (nom. ined.)]
MVPKILLAEIRKSPNLYPRTNVHFIYESLPSWCRTTKNHERKIEVASCRHPFAKELSLSLFAHFGIRACCSLLVHVPMRAGSGEGNSTAAEYNLGGGFSWSG